MVEEAFALSKHYFRMLFSLTKEEKIVNIFKSLEKLT